MDRSRGIVVFRACIAAACAAVLTAGTARLVGADTGPFPEATYDIYLGIKAFLGKDSSPDPFLVILEHSPAQSSRYAPVRSISSYLNVIRAAGVSGLFVTDVFRTAEAETEPLNAVLNGIPIVMTGGICANSGSTVRAPRFPIPGTPPPDIPRAGGFYETGGVFKAYTAGFLNILPDPDGIIRRVPLVYRLADEYIPSAILAYALRYLQIPFSELAWINSRYLKLGFAVRLPVDRAGNLLISYPYAWDDAFYTYHTDSFTLPDRYLVPQLRQELLNAFVFLIDSMEQSNSIYAPNRKIFPAAGIAPILVNQIRLDQSIEITPVPHQALYSALWIAGITAVLVFTVFSSGAVWVPPLLGAVLIWLTSGALLILTNRYFNPVPGMFSSLFLFSFSVWWKLSSYRRFKKSESLLRKQEQAFVLLGKDAAGLNHAVKGQISLARNFARLLNEEPLTAQGRTELTFLTRTLDELSESVNSVLSRLHTKETRLCKTPVPAALRSFVQSRSNAPGLPPVSLDIQPNANSSVCIDPDSFARIMEILYTNALESGTDSIAIVYSEKPDTGIITVTDRGKGFRDCMQCMVSHCMDCATIQVGKTTKKGGSGFGLFWARTLIARNNGKLRIRSSQESGTSVQVQIPTSQKALEESR